VSRPFANADLDPGLIDRAVAGDGQALEKVLQAVQPHVFRFAHHLCRNGEDAADVLQETLLSLFRHASQLRDEAALTTWLYVVARNHCIKKSRRRISAQLEVPLEAADNTVQLASDAANPEQVLRRRETGTLLERAIGSLPAASREVLLLRDVEGQSAAQAAQIVGLSVSALKSRLHRARSALRDEIQRLLKLRLVDEVPLAGCPDIIERYSQNLEGDMSPQLCTQLQQHVAGCRRCRATCDEIKDTLAACASLPGAAVPQAVQAEVRTAVKKLISRRAAETTV